MNVLKSLQSASTPVRGESEVNKMIKPKQSLATHNFTKKFEKVSMDIFYYVQLGIIKLFDMVLYVKYLELFNED